MKKEFRRISLIAPGWILDNDKIIVKKLIGKDKEYLISEIYDVTNWLEGSSYPYPFILFYHSGKDVALYYDNEEPIKSQGIEAYNYLVSNSREGLIKKEKEEAEFNEKSKKIYNICLEKGYDIKNSEVSNIICQSYNISKKELKLLYNRGKEMAEIELEQKLSENRDKEKDIVDLEKKNTEEYGKNKYFDYLDKQLNFYDKQATVSREIRRTLHNSAVLAENYPQKSDAFLWGGMANGIAGPAAGIATVNRINAENEQRRIEERKYAEAARKDAIEWSKRTMEANQILEASNYIKNKITESLIINDIDKLKNKIKFTKIEYKILDTKNFSVNVNYELNNLKVLKNDAILDGCFKITIYKDKEIISTGYYNAPNINIPNDIFWWNNPELNIKESKVGLNNKNSFETICISKDYKKIDLKEKYTVKIDIIHLWLIEKFI